MCRSCFVRNNSLDFSCSVDVLGPDKGAAPCVLFVHGGGSCRRMFALHARVFAKRGFRCVLLDLPGHGALMDEPLSLESAINRIVEVTEEYTSEYKGQKPIYVGGSLGGYIGMELLGQFPQIFGKAVITMCGQNVGVGRGLAATLGLWSLGKAVAYLPAATLLKMMISASAQNGHISSEVMQELALRCGFFFHQGPQQIEILSSSDPARALKQFEGEVLFINGSKDHRDSEKLWLAACKKGELKVYPGADHFFSHDSRFVDQFLEDLAVFMCAKEE